MPNVTNLGYDQTGRPGEDGRRSSQGLIPHEEASADFRLNPSPSAEPLRAPLAICLDTGSHVLSFDTVFRGQGPDRMCSLFFLFLPTDPKMFSLRPFLLLPPKTQTQRKFLLPFSFSH